MRSTQILITRTHETTALFLLMRVRFFYFLILSILFPGKLAPRKKGPRMVAYQQTSRKAFGSVVVLNGVNLTIEKS